MTRAESEKLQARGGKAHEVQQEGLALVLFGDPNT